MTPYQPAADAIDLQQPDAGVEDDELPSPRYYRGPYSASTPAITLSSSVNSSVIALSNEPEPMQSSGQIGLRSTRSSPSTPSKLSRSRMAASSQTLPLPTPEHRFQRPSRPQQTTITGPPPSQSGDESVQLALVLAFGNEKYSSALSLPLSPTRRPFSTPPTAINTPSSSRHPHSAPSSPPTTPHSPRSPRSPRPDSRPPPPPPLDLRFGSEYTDVTSPTSTSSSGTQGSFRTSQAAARRSAYNLNSQPLRKPEGTLEVPIPLMLRPRPMWRTTPRSALSSPAYAPAAHLVRRSTFIAAGLDLNAPVADMSALGVETRAVMFGRDAGVSLPGFDL